MLRFALALGTGLACLMLAQTASPAAVPADGDLLLVLQKDKEKHYSVNKRLDKLKGKSGHYRIGSTSAGHKIGAHLKNGKIHKMSLTHKDGTVVHHKKVTKAKKVPDAATKLKAPAKGVHKVARGSEPDADVVAVAMRRQGFVYAAFWFITPGFVRVIWVPIAFVDPVVFISATDGLEVRDTPPPSPRLERLPPPLPALLPRRVDLELG
jgi:hypothetical protein